MAALVSRLSASAAILLCARSAHAAVSLHPFPPLQSADPNPAQLCRAAISATESTARIPDAFLSAMGRIESGRPEGGTLSPWPWTVNAAGVGHFYPTKQAAVQAVRQFQAAGIRSVDVGCLQVNLFYHPEAFTSLEEAFEPAANAAFAARLLLDLFARTGSWPRAAAAYHSMTPALGMAYQQKVLEQWAVPDRPGDKAPPGSADRHMKAHPDRLIPPTQAPQSQMLAAAAPTRPANAGEAAPSLGFHRRFMLPAPRLAAGRTLAAYRAMPVQLAWRQAAPLSQ